MKKLNLKVFKIKIKKKTRKLNKNNDLYFIIILNQ